MSSDWRSDDTQEMPQTSSRGVPRQSETGSSRTKVDLGKASHRGHVRRANEDHYLVVRCGRSLETLSTSLPDEVVPAREEEIGYGLLVADGMGGTGGGEQASRIALSTLVALILRTHGWLFSDDADTATEVMRRFADRFRLIHEVLRDHGRDDPKLANMGTTLTLAMSLGHSLVIGHIGDSRAYLLRDGALFQLTRDHTLVTALVESGCISSVDAEHHPSRHILTACLGGGGSQTPADFQHATLLEGDQLLLCTDGLTEMVDKPAITETLLNSASAQDACEKLVASALAAGGSDNVTVVLARYRFFD